jgi:ABC-type transport system substrate-binding protein
MRISRRHLLQAAGAAGIAAPALDQLLLPKGARAQSGTVTVAYNVNLPSWDPTVGLSAVNPTIQSLYKAVFDQYVDQNPDLSFKPGLLTDWGWIEDRTKVHMTVREGAKWHDGMPVTPEDVVWSLERAGDPEGGNPIQFVWGKVGNYVIDGNTVTGDVLAFEPTLKWDITIMRKMSAMLAGGLFNVRFDGSGMLAITTHYDPVTLRVTPNQPVFTDPNATIAWSGGLTPEFKTDISLKTFLGRGSGESIQMMFNGDGFVVIQPYEEASLQAAKGAQG